MARSIRRYSAKVKFQAVLEALKGGKAPGQIARAYGIHPNAVGLWNHMLLERGPELFDGASGSRDSGRRLAELERTGLVLIGGGNDLARQD